MVDKASGRPASPGDRQAPEAPQTGGDGHSRLSSQLLESTKAEDDAARMPTQRRGLTAPRPRLSAASETQRCEQAEPARAIRTPRFDMTSTPVGDSSMIR